MTKNIVNFLKYLLGVHRTNNLEEWLLSKYKPSIEYYNESDCFDPLSHLLIDLGETYMSIKYNEQIGKDFNVSERDFNKTSRDVYDRLVHEYSDSEDLNYPLYIH